MGYRTTFQLNAQPLPAPDPAQAIAEFVEHYPEAFHCLNDDGSTCESGKWYDHEAQLKEFSRRYPGLVFTLRGEGEEPGDIWEKDFCNGRMVDRAASVQVPEQDLSVFLEARDA